jgi:hypothetical protein
VLRCSGEEDDCSDESDLDLNELLKLLKRNKNKKQRAAKMRAEKERAGKESPRSSSPSVL